MTCSGLRPARSDFMGIFLCYQKPPSMTCRGLKAGEIWFHGLFFCVIKSLPRTGGRMLCGVSMWEPAKAEQAKLFQRSLSLWPAQEAALVGTWSYPTAGSWHFMRLKHCKAFPRGIWGFQLAFHPSNMLRCWATLSLSVLWDGSRCIFWRSLARSLGTSPIRGPLKQSQRVLTSAGLTRRSRLRREVIRTQWLREQLITESVFFIFVVVCCSLIVANGMMWLAPSLDLVDPLTVCSDM